MNLKIFDIEEVRAIHMSLASSVENIIKTILQQNKIEYLTVSHRVKTAESIKEKLRRKKYKDPHNELTDISGIRIISFLESDVQKIIGIIKNSFEISKEHSSNKSDSLSIDKIGYRSHHFVATLGSGRSRNPEYSNTSNLYFEIQIRTVLQHAWAVLSHDRNYKFEKKLPKEIERKLNLFSGLLEIADNGFSEIAKEIDNYSLTISQNIEKKSDIDINSISLKNFIETWSNQNNVKIEELNEKNDSTIFEIINELEFYGVKSIQDLESFIPKEFAKNYIQSGYITSIYGLIRDWMLINDWRKILLFPERDWVLDNNPEDFSEYDEENDLMIRSYQTLLSAYLNNSDIEEMFNTFKTHDFFNLPK